MFGKGSANRSGIASQGLKNNNLEAYFLRWLCPTTVGTERTNIKNKVSDFACTSHVGSAQQRLGQSSQKQSHFQIKNE